MTGYNRPLNYTTDGGIRYALMEGYPTIAGEDLMRTSASEKYLIQAGDAAAFYRESFPPPSIAGGYVDLPARRRMPGSNFLITKKLNFEPFPKERTTRFFAGAPAGTPDPHSNLCLVTIDYETMLESDANPRQANRPETFLERSMTAGGEFLMINPKKLDIVDAPVGQTISIGQGGGPTIVNISKEPNEDFLMPIPKSVVTAEWSCKWTYALSPDWTEIFAQLGTVNKTEYVFLENASRETVMFAGVSGAQRYFWGGGDDPSDTTDEWASLWELEFKFSQRQINGGSGIVAGWNHVWSPKKQKFIKPLLNSEELYTSSDFLDLFKAAV
jgi:hypothetical protein